MKLGAVSSGWRRPVGWASTAATVAGGLAALLFAVSVQVRMVATRQIRDEGWRWDRVPAVELLSRLPPLGRRVAADILWVRAIQCYGYHRQTDRTFSALAPHFDGVTRVDPCFEQAYAFGGLVIAQDAGQPEVGVDLLRRGMAFLPESWRLPFEVGFVYYVEMGDPKRAARYFELASTLPDSPPYVKHFAAYACLRAGRRDMARCFWMAILKETESEAVRRLAAEALARIGESEPRGGSGLQPVPDWRARLPATPQERMGT
jgi:hypothetical protein